MNVPFKVGDTVRLIPNGRTMTVKDVGDILTELMVTCVWEENGKQEWDRFLPRQLELVKH
jgi:uncharacterized protein YodC (DUF2158 family)